MRDRVVIGVALVLAAVALSAADFWRWLRVWRVSTSPGYVDEVTLSDRNCAAVRDQLPPRGRVGFGGAKPDGDSYMITQYSLVPLVLAHDADPPVVVEVVTERGGLRSVRVSRPKGQ